MAAVADVPPIPYVVLLAASLPEPEDAVIFVGIALALGAVSKFLLRGTPIPYTVALLVLGNTAQNMVWEKWGLAFVIFICNGSAPTQGQTQTLSTAINESNEDGEEAKKFLKDVRMSFPQAIGLLGKKEMVYLDDVLQAPAW